MNTGSRRTVLSIYDRPLRGARRESLSCKELCRESEGSGKDGGVGGELTSSKSSRLPDSGFPIIDDKKPNITKLSAYFSFSVFNALQDIETLGSLLMRLNGFVRISLRRDTLLL